MSPHAYFRSLASYHAWATRRFFERIDTIPEDDYRRDVGLCFKSLHGSLNHLLVAECHLWFPRFAKGRSNALPLDTELESDRVRLRGRLLACVDAWAPLIATWPAERFDGLLDYRNTRGESQRLPFAPTLGHVFNHATHHRGQISAAVTLLAHPVVETDWVAWLQAESRAASPSA